MGKLCTKCGIVRRTKSFPRNCNKPGGLGQWCKKCQAKYKKAQYKLHRSMLLEKHRKYYLAHRLERITSARNYVSTHKEQRRDYIRRWQLLKRKKDIGYRILCNLRSRVHHALRGDNKSRTTLQLLGCSISQFRLHIQEQFQPGMSWSNYGKWQLDHIRPCALFNLTNKREQEQCFHYTNLQPLWKLDNQHKGKHYVQ